MFRHGRQGSKQWIRLRDSQWKQLLRKRKRKRVADFDESVSTQAQSTQARTDVQLVQRGWASFVGMTGAVYNADGTEKRNFDYQWELNGLTAAEGKATNGISDLINGYIPGSDAIGKELTLRIFSLNNANENDNLDVTISAGTVTKQTVDSDVVSSKILPDQQMEDWVTYGTILVLIAKLNQEMYMRIWIMKQNYVM